MDRIDGPEIIIVAGLSGSGKTTFLRQLKSGRLTDELELPVGAARWPVVQIEAGKQVCLQKMRRAIMLTRRARGIIVHYDLQGQSARPNDFAHDKALALGVSLAKTLIVINLRVTPARIIRQLTDRETEKFAKGQLARSRLVWQLTLPALKAAVQILPKRLAKALRRYSPFGKTGHVERLEAKLRPYASPGRLDAVYRGWAAYLNSIEEAGKPVQQIFVEPGSEPFSWRRTGDRTFLCVALPVLFHLPDYAFCVVL